MTPETANGRGSIPVITDGTLPVDLAPPPPGVNDIPGAKSTMKGVGKTVGGGVDTVSRASAQVAQDSGQDGEEGGERHAEEEERNSCAVVEKVDGGVEKMMVESMFADASQ